MSEPQWEDVDVPRGSYISWGGQPGTQEVIGKVIDYSPLGGTDFQGNPCPQVSVELRSPAFSINKQGQRTDHQIGELVIINAGIVSLKRAVQYMQMKPGDLIKIKYARDVPVTGGSVKEFDVQIARVGGHSNGQQHQQPPQQYQSPPQQYQPPPQQYQQPPQPYSQPPMAAQAQPQPASQGQGWSQPQQSQPPF